MAKSAGLFKKKEVHPSAKQPAAPPQRAAKEDHQKGTVDDAFDEIMAEEKPAEPTNKLFHESNRLEDELIQYLEEDSASAENGIAPPEAPAEKPPLRINLRSELTRKDAAPLQLRFNRDSESQGPRPSAGGGAVARIAGERPEQKIAPLPPPSPKSLMEEDTIYEMLKSPEFSIKKALPISRSLRQPERPAQQRMLRAPPPRVEPAEKISFTPPVIERAVEMPARPAPAAAAERRAAAGIPILTEINREYMTLTLLMRWIEFLMERVTREKLSLVMDYYVNIGWISDKVRVEAMTYARGEMQDVTKYMQHEEEISDESPELKVSPAAAYKKVDDWRLSADDHLKSLLFITKMAGIEVDRDRLNSLEQSIKRFKENLEGYYGV
jgi:archaellum component FlaD/FlaE